MCLFFNSKLMSCSRAFYNFTNRKIGFSRDTAFNDIKFSHTSRQMSENSPAVHHNHDHSLIKLLIVKPCVFLHLHLINPTCHLMPAAWYWPASGCAHLPVIKCDVIWTTLVVPAWDVVLNCLLLCVCSQLGNHMSWECFREVLLIRLPGSHFRCLSQTVVY